MYLNQMPGVHFFSFSTSHGRCICYISHFWYEQLLNCQKKRVPVYLNDSRTLLGS